MHKKAWKTEQRSDPLEFVQIKCHFDFGGDFWTLRQKLYIIEFCQN